MRAFPVVIGLSALAFPAPSFAEPATQSGADALIQAYEAYVGKELVDKGVLSIAPQGDSYVVTWDFQKALDLEPHAAPHVTIAPFVYAYTPAGAGAWTISADKFPAIAFSGADSNAAQSGEVACDGFRLEISYDEQRADFLTSAVETARISAKLRGRKDDRDEIIDVSALGASGETAVRNGASGAGVDVDYKSGLKSFSEVVSTATPGGEPAPDAVTISEESIVDAGSIKGLRAAEIGKMWRDAVAAADDEARAKAALVDLKAALPFWDNYETRVDVGALSIRGPRAEVSVKALGELINLDGVKRSSGAKFGVKVDGLALKSPVAPPWVAQFSPMSLDFEIAGAVDGLDEAAAAAIEDALQSDSGALSDEAQDKIDAILAAGHPAVTIPPGRLTLPFVDVAFEGKAQFGPDSREAHFVVSVDSLDKTFDVVKAIAQSNPRAGVAIAGLAMIKGLAKPGDNGRLIWAIDVSADGKTTVNGAPLPIPD